MLNRTAEWLETDGLGGFASGTVSGVRTRRYHALLLAAMRPPTDRIVLVNGFDAWVNTPAGSFALSSQRYLPDAVHPERPERVSAFEHEPWPRWTFELEDGTQIEQEIFVRHGIPFVVLSWRLVESRNGITFSLRPFLSGRDYHALHHENLAFRFEPEMHGERLIWRPYPGVPGILAASNGDYRHQPDWYRNFVYEEERARGLDHAEDLASPGLFRWDLSSGEAALVLTVEGQEGGALPSGQSVEACVKALRGDEERRRAQFPSPLHRAADSYLVRRGNGRTIVAGYPWFTDWGRDTFISLRGLCLATGRLEEARGILLEWAGAMSDGMLPNRFPDQGEAPEVNSVDASLWFVIAVHESLRAMEAAKGKVSLSDRKRLHEAVEAILSGYAKGTRYGIRLDEDGLLAAGVPGVQLTWMDAKVGDWVVTPRIGKPVEVEALWLNALWIGSRFAERWEPVFRRGRESFRTRFWNEPAGCLYDVIDCDHQPDVTDSALRPNQIFAAGGLPLALLEGDQARRVVQTVEERLWTPLGLRSLAPGEPGYAPRYERGARERDVAYHQRTVWPWLLGPFVEAWVCALGGTREARREARGRFLDPMLGHLDRAGLGHISEIADAESPFTPRGCPFQAWSVGEALRLSEIVLR